MSMPRKVCVVEDILTITGRGPVVMIKQWQAEQIIKQGDWIELRSGTGERHQAQVKAIDSVWRSAGREPGANAGGTICLCLIGLSRDAVQAGDEIWPVGAAN